MVMIVVGPGQRLVVDDRELMVPEGTKFLEVVTCGPNHKVECKITWSTNVADQLVDDLVRSWGVTARLNKLDTSTLRPLAELVIPPDTVAGQGGASWSGNGMIGGGSASGGGARG